MRDTSSESPDRAVALREVAAGDLPLFFEHQRDAVANRMAAFPPRGRAAFVAHWTKILADKAVVKRTILFGSEVAGYIVCFEQSARWLVGYWLGRPFWGKGIATRALADFLSQVRVRPLHAYVAKTNLGSIRVLEKCGFAVSGEGAAPAGTGDVVEEFVYTLVA